MYEVSKLWFLVVLLYAIVDARAPPSWVPTQQGLTRLFFSSRVTAQNPRLSMECFADYILHSNEISETYSTNYNQCLLTAKKSRAEADSKMLPEHTKIVHASNEVCNQISVCNNLNSTLQMFNCHADAGSNNTRQAYTLSNNSSELASQLQEQYRTIDLNHDHCTKTAESEYVESSAYNYEYLHECLDGRVKPRPPPTSSTSTTTTTTSTTTTTTTTEPPNTETTPLFDESTEGIQRLQDQFTKLLNLLH